MATPGLSVWVVDDDESVRWVLEQARALDPAVLRGLGTDGATRIADHLCSIAGVRRERAA